LLAELDKMYYLLKFFRSEHIYLKRGLDSKLLGLYEHILSTYEGIMNAAMTARLNSKRSVVLMSSTPPNGDNYNNIVTRAITSLRQVENELEKIKKRIILLKKYYRLLLQLQPNLQLDENEYIVFIKKHKQLVIVVTNLRLMVVHKDPQHALFFYLDDISYIKIKTGLLFKGVKIELKDHQTIKICMDIRDAKKLKKTLERMKKIDKNIFTKLLDKLNEERLLIRPNIRTMRLEALRTLIHMK